MDVDGPEEFWAWMDRVETDACGGDQHARLVLGHVVAALDLLRRLPEAPSGESEMATLKRVRQSRRYPLWRVSHVYHPDVAVRLICWFPPKVDTVVVTLFAGDKAKIGDIWYSSVAARADALIDQWTRETSYDNQ
ncbi:hypothetical protein [Sphaerisporangium sp. NPDC051011]|uniref:hypothetical protein n=1 Tax=Sphaerisporangium sp. NPDC051011 TaxID=3155792 RepID=UPI0033D57066